MYFWSYLYLIKSRGLLILNHIIWGNDPAPDSSSSKKCSSINTYIIPYQYGRLNSPSFFMLTTRWLDIIPHHIISQLLGLNLSFALILLCRKAPHQVLSWSSSGLPTVGKICLNFHPSRNNKDIWSLIPKDLSRPCAISHWNWFVDDGTCRKVWLLPNHFIIFKKSETCPLKFYIDFTRLKLISKGLNQVLVMKLYLIYSGSVLIPNCSGNTSVISSVAN